MALIFQLFFSLLANFSTLCTNMYLDSVFIRRQDENEYLRHARYAVMHCALRKVLKYWLQNYTKEKDRIIVF